jgi:hypothetical protein
MNKCKHLATIGFSYPPLIFNDDNQSRDGMNSTDLLDKYLLNPSVIDQNLQVKAFEAPRLSFTLQVSFFN